MQEWNVFGATNTTKPIRAFVAKNPAAKSNAPYIFARVATAPTPTIRAFVAKNPAAKSIAPYISARVATAPTPTIRAFLAKNLDAGVRSIEAHYPR